MAEDLPNKDSHTVSSSCRHGTKEVRVSWKLQGKLTKWNIPPAVLSVENRRKSAGVRFDQQSNKGQGPVVDELIKRSLVEIRRSVEN